MERGAIMAWTRYLAILAVAVAQEPRRLKFSFGDVSYSSNGVSNSPIGQVNNVMNQAQSQMVQPGQEPKSEDPFASLSDTPFGGDPFKGFGGTPKQEKAKGFALTPQNGAVVLQGMIHAFLAHKQLQQGEMQCLEQGTSAMGSQAAAVAQNIVMIGENIMSVENVGNSPGAMPGMPSMTAPTKSPSDAKMEDASSMFDQMFNSAAGASSGSPSPSSAASQGAKPPPNPFDMFKGLVNHDSASPAPAPAPAPTNNVNTALNMWSMEQGRRLQMGGMMGMGMGGGMGGMGGGMGGPPGAPGAGGGMDPMMMMGGAAMAAQLAKQVQDLSKLAHKVMAKCLQGDAQQALKIAAERAQNPAWLQKAMVGNGPKALGHMADAITAYHDGDARMFGDSVGIVMREILLNNPQGVTLETLPDEKALANVTGGFMKGFFGEGMSATIKTPEEPNGIPIDLHKCVGKNVGLFQSMWASVMNFYKKQGMPSSQADKEQQATLLAYAAMQMPRALKMCNLGEEEIQALKDAIAGMGKGVKMSVHIPKPQSSFSQTEAMTDMAKTVSGYQKLVQDPSKGIDFGKDLGGLFQKVVENGFAEKYYVDSDGNLRKRLLSLSSEQGRFAGAQQLVPTLLVLVVVLLLLVLVAVKSRRAFAGWKEHLCQMECTESGIADKMMQHSEDLEDVHEIEPILDEVQ